MGKRKRQETQGPSRPKNGPAPKKKQQTPAKKVQESHAKPTIPFEVDDHILLIGEGDFSFARSLVEHHGCADLTATCFDSETQLAEKYPQAVDNADLITTEGQAVLYGVDATKLSQKEIRKGGKWQRIIFNFPHVGGKSTDVNRQVRYNQEMLVGFFKTSAPLLAHEGTIVVTLFEGEPYTLWNIRDLARHSDLEVQRSFKFQPEAYPGYAHARTLGNIEGGGGWKGETRLARTFIFQAKSGGGQNGPAGGSNKKRKRKGGESDSESEG